MLLCISFDHRQADLALLERIERRTAEVTAALGDPEFARGAVVLATCNRFEAYLDAPVASARRRTGAGSDPGSGPGIGQISGPPSESVVEPATGPASEAPGATATRSDPVSEHVLRELARAAELPPSELARACSVHHGDAVAEHLFAVSSGLESAAVGEGEIAGQVRRAIDSARESGRSSTELEQLFRHAMVVSKRVKHRTGLQSKGRSLVQLALAMVDSRVGDWRGSRILLIGTGAYAGASLAALRARGAAHIAVHSPSGRAEAFAASHGIRPVPAEHLDAELRASDLVVACSSMHEPLLTRERFDETTTEGNAPFCARFVGGTGFADSRAASPRLRVRPRLLIDMGLPRNIAPDVAGVPGVELLDLETIALHAPIPEFRAELEARDLVRTAAVEFAAVRAEREAVPALRELRSFVDAILEDEISRVRGRNAGSGNSPGSGNGEEVEAALRHLVGRLLHRPTVRLRELGRSGRASEGSAAVSALFGEA